MNHGRSLELFNIDGRPGGMLTAEMFNWTGHVLLTPRTQLPEALRRPDTSYTGVYMLLGEREDGTRVYLGESEDIGARLRTHDIAKDWWNTAIFVTTAGNKLNKAHVRYLEARLIAEAKRIGRTLLENGTAPANPPLSEADRAKMEAFLTDLLIALPAVRVDTFIERTRHVEMRSATSSSIKSGTASFSLEARKHGLRATARVEQGEFIVEEGSLARASWEGRGSEDTGYARLHAELCREGVLPPYGGHRRFIRSYVFKSPSAASAVILGRPDNGTLSWQNQATGETYKAWEAARLAASNVASSV